MTKATSAHARAALLKTFPKNEYATLFEVNEGTGIALGRRADALVQSLWPSRGLELWGFEVKVARNDWLNELKNASKADAIARYCHRWIVLASPGVVKQAELPVSWGLWEFNPDTLDIKRTVQAPLLAPVPMTPTFFASVMRAAAKPDALDVAELTRSIRTKVEAEVLERLGATKPSWEQIRDAEKVTVGLDKLRAIEKATGLDLMGYSSSETEIALIKLARHPGVYINRLQQLLSLMEDENLRAQLHTILDMK